MTREGLLAEARSMEVRARLTRDERERVLGFAKRADEAAGRAYKRGDFISATNHMKTAARYRDMAYRGVAV